MKRDKNVVLDLWASGGTTTSIAREFKTHRGVISNIILRARDRGDTRAVTRKRGPKSNTQKETKND